MSNNLIALFVIDCGPEVGLGHLRRSLCLADEMARRGVHCTISVADQTGLDIVRETQFEAQLWPQNIQDFPPADIVVIDSYRIGVERMRDYSGLFDCRVVFDDLGDREIDAELILNQNLFAKNIKYSKGTKTLLGAEYACIDPRFSDPNLHRPNGESTNRVLISFGGTDGGTFGLPAAQAVLAASDKNIVDLVISPMVKKSNEMLDFETRQNRKVKIYHGADMVGLMKGCDLYVGGAGSTVLEAAAAGIPVIAIEMGENHRLNGNALRSLGVPVLDDLDVSNLEREVREILLKMESGFKGDRLMEIVDGDGAKRVSKEIIGYFKANMDAPRSVTIG